MASTAASAVDGGGAFAIGDDLAIHRLGRGAREDHALIP
jgi:hypothetical protein